MIGVVHARISSGDGLADAHRIRACICLRLILPRKRTSRRAIPLLKDAETRLVFASRLGVNLASTDNDAMAQKEARVPG